MKTSLLNAGLNCISNFKPLLIGMLISTLIVSCDDDPTLGGITPVTLSACMPSNLQSDLIVYYGFDNGSLQDLSGNSRHLSNTTTASAAADRNGSPTCAFHFNRDNNEFLTRTNADFLNSLDEISISLWFNSDTLDNYSPFEILMCRGEGGHCPDTHGEWSLALYDCRRPVLGYGNNSFWAEMITPMSDNWCQDNVDLTDGIWHHLAATYDGVTCTIWFDGVATSYPAELTGTCMNPEIMEDLGAFFLGKDYSGSLDDVAIFDRSLTADEVNQLRQWAPCCVAP